MTAPLALPGNDSELAAEARRRLAVLHPLGTFAASTVVVDVRGDQATMQVEQRSVGLSPEPEPSFSLLHDAAHRFLRPVLSVRLGAVDPATSTTWRARIDPVRSRLEAASRSVGVLRAPGHPADAIGVLWMIGPDLAITSRAVAAEIARPTGRGVRFRLTLDGTPFDPWVQFADDPLSVGATAAQVLEVLYLGEFEEATGELALLRLQARPGALLPPPVPLLDDEALVGQYVALAAAGGDTSRLVAPGQATCSGSTFRFDADCSDVLSGGVVLDLASGAAVGLHFATSAAGIGYAVSSSGLRAALIRAGRSQRTPAALLPSPPNVTTSSVDAARSAAVVELRDFTDRDGYNPTFLGNADFSVPLPTMSRSLTAKAVQVPGARPRGVERYTLKYRHFSVAMHAERRFAIFSATNLDGAETKRIKRASDPWGFDPRLPATAQVGNELYDGNDLDRGHLTRRLDPAWGDLVTAKQAERDTFYFTNATPQIARFNQQLWAGLEDYLLDHADMDNFRATVFTGPVFSGNDRPYRGVLLPLAYWKVVAMIDLTRQQLAATAYVVSQADEIGVMGFTFGAYKTYQVPISRVETLTGLGFARLRPFDPLAGPTPTGLAQAPRELLRLQDILLRPAAVNAIPGRPVPAGRVQRHR